MDENLDSLENLESKRQAVKETIESIIKVEED